ncbi:MAG: helix-turn-helix transcriptional regulator [Deltaproteobacteria bacterium]|nr:helix-turn-helix transcriptional regulator [Deltaproteobacteria bacterium]
MSMQRFNEALVALRNKWNLTQKEFARALGISQQYLCDIEKGRALPTVRFVEKLIACSPGWSVNWNVLAAQAHGWKV